MGMSDEALLNRLPERIGQRFADWTGRDRKRASLHRAETAQAAGGVVVRRQRRSHAGLAPEPRQPAVGQLLGSSKEGCLNDNISLNRTQRQQPD